MEKKLILLVALLSGISIVAMEEIKETPVLQEASHHEEESLVTIRLIDSQHTETPHEVAIPVCLAKLMGVLVVGLEEPALRAAGFPLPNVTIGQWYVIEPQLERVYRISQDASQAALLRQEIITEFRKLDVKSLIGVICASDYLEIPILLESACEVLKQSALDNISWDELEVLPRDIRNQIIMNKALMLLGPVPAKELALCRHEGAVTTVCVSQDGKIFSGSYSYDGTVRIWDMECNQLVVCRGHGNAVRSVCVMKEGKIVSGSFDRTIRVWDMQGNQLAICRGHEGYVMSVCVTKEGKIVSGSEDKTVRVWDMQGNQLAICRGHEDMFISVCVTEDGKIVSGSYDNTLRIWDMEGNQLAVCSGNGDEITSNCVTRDGKIVSGSRDKTVRVWDMEGNQLAVCRGHEGIIVVVYVTKDGKIVSGSRDKTIRVWDIEGNQLAVCRGHEDWVSSVTVTSDGKIVSGSGDCTVRVWDMEGNQLAICRAHESVVSSVCVTKDGKIVSGSDDKIVRVWDSGLLDTILNMDESRAWALWAYLRNLPHDIDQQTCWREIEKILEKDAAVAPNNSNNE